MNHLKKKIAIILTLCLILFYSSALVRAEENVTVDNVGITKDYIVKQGDWLYFKDTEGKLCKSKTNGSNFIVLCPDKVVSRLVFYQKNIFCITEVNSQGYLTKVNTETGEKQILEEASSSYGIDVYGIIDDTLYYAYMKDLSNDGNDSGIRTWTMKTDGSDKVKTDAFIDDSYAQININGRGIYYIAWSGELNFMEKGKNKPTTLVSHKVTGYRIVNNDIYYTKMLDNNEYYDGSLVFTGAEIGKITLAGKNQEVLKKFTDTKVISLLGVKNKWIYYSKKDGKTQFEESVYRIKTDATGNKKLVQGIHNDLDICLTDKKMIYATKSDEVYTLWSRNLDGTGKKKLTQHRNEGSSNYISFGSIQPMDTWLYYSANQNLYRLKGDGTKKHFVSELYITRNVKKLTNSVYDPFLFDQALNLSLDYELNLQNVEKYSLLDINQDKSKELLLFNSHNEVYIFQSKNKKVSYLTMLYYDTMGGDLKYSKKYKCIVSRMVSANGGMSYDILGIKNGKPETHYFYNYQNIYVYDKKNITSQKFEKLAESYTKGSVDIILKSFDR